MGVTNRNGHYYVDFYYYYADGTRERIRKKSPVNNKRGAERFERELRQSMQDGTFKKERDVIPTFKEFSVDYLDSYAAVYNRPSTIRSKKKNLRAHLIPEFGQYRLNQINRKKIDRYIGKKQKSGLSPKTIKNHLTDLRRMLVVAKEWELIESIPTIKAPPVPQKDQDFLSFEEAGQLIDAAEGQCKTMIIVALKTGLRLGELLGLKWSDIDFRKRSLQVKRSFHRGHIGSTKSGKNRTISLNVDAYKALKAHKKKGSELVFANENGEHLTDDMCARMLKKAKIKAGIQKKFGWHMFRHTFASHLVIKGKSIVVVKELLGHSDIRMTMRYAHLNNDVLHDAVQALNSVQP